MNINTEMFGEMEIDENNIIEFETGLPAFFDEKSFVIVTEDENKESVLCWLQSTKTPELVFALINIFSIMPDYKPIVNEEDIFDLGEYNENDFFVYSITSVPDNIEDITANLKAPIIINMKTKKGKQVIINNDAYSIKYKIFEKLKNRK